MTERRRLGGIIGLGLISIAVALAWWLSDSCAAIAHVVLPAWLGGSVAMLAIGRRSYEVRNHEPSCLEYWSETAWACLCTVVAGLGVGALIAVLSTTKLLSLDSSTGYAACAPTRSEKVPEALGPGNNVTEKDEISKSSNTNKTSDPGAHSKKRNQEGETSRKGLEKTSKKNLETSNITDLEETLKKELNDKFAFWGTLFAWLLAILALAVTVFIWSLQRGAQDLKERFEALEDYRKRVAQDLKERFEALEVYRTDLTQRFDKHHILLKLQDHQLSVEDMLESSREQNPKFQFIRVVQRLILTSRQVQSREFSARVFAQQTERLEGALDALSQAPSRWDVAQLKPRALAAALRAVAEYLHSVGPLPWLPTAEWPGNIQKLFDLAERLDTLA